MTPQQLIASGIHPTQAAQFAGPLTDACNRFGITTPLRQAAFVAQCAHESAGFTMLVENLNYHNAAILDGLFSAVHGLADAKALIAAGPIAIANRVYANRNGNGDESSGDGWAYRGRGLIQVTGRSNYSRMTVLISDGNDYESVPDLLAQPEWACLSAAAWWQSHGCNALADTGSIDQITRVVNGPAMAGEEDRRELYALAKGAYEGVANA